MTSDNSKLNSQKKLPLRNYNIFALQGDETVDDMDVVETMGLDTAVAYTPNINTAAINKMKQENIDYYINKMNLAPKEAERLAQTSAEATKATVNTLMRDQQIDFRI